MLFKELKSKFKSDLIQIYDEVEVLSFFYLTLEKWHNLKRIDLALNPDLELPNDFEANWVELIYNLQQEKPIQYLLGEAHFFGLNFFVNHNVLIPRQETEELVSWILEDSDKNAKLKILDLGTGSGCIPISLATEMPNASIKAFDVSEEALDVAQKNAKNLGVSVQFVKQDIFEIHLITETFDIIVSNPPYVRLLEKSEIKKNVLEYEPHLALFVSDTDALIFYRKIGEWAYLNLSENGSLYFEINQYLTDDTILLLKSIGFHSVELRKDIYGNDRMIKAKREF